MNHNPPDAIEPSASSSVSKRRLYLLNGLKIGAALGAVALAVTLATNDESSIASAKPWSLSERPALVQPAPREARYADFGGQPASPEAQHIAHWVVDSGDNQRMNFVIIDKKDARLYVFEPGGKLRGSAPVLLGSAQGDHTVPGIGNKPLSEVLPEERTTPAGRFIAEPGSSTFGEDVVWIDYDAAVSMHRVRALVTKERRLERLASPTPEDNRISFGCVNVPVAFYEQILQPSFDKRYGVVYVLPEVKSLQEVFNSYDIFERYGRQDLCATGLCDDKPKRTS
jgi:hypothetical protein